MSQHVVTIQQGTPEWAILLDALQDPDLYKVSIATRPVVAEPAAGGFAIKVNEYTWTHTLPARVDVVPDGSVG